VAYFMFLHQRKKMFCPKKWTLDMLKRCCIDTTISVCKMHINEVRVVFLFLINIHFSVIRIYENRTCFFSEFFLLNLLCGTCN
jgi:hypothetical protein